MTAVEKYRRLLDDARNTQTGKLHIGPRQALDAADAAIAELEAENGRMDDALHSAYQDWLDDFPNDSPMEYDKWLAVHVPCGKEMRAL